MLYRYRVRRWERGLRFVDGDLTEVWGEGTYWVLDPRRRTRVDVVNVRDPWLRSRDLDVIARSPARPADLMVVNLGDAERALVWVDGRFEAALEPGLYALWTTFRDVRVEVVEARRARLVRDDVAQLFRANAEAVLERVNVDAGWVGLCYEDGRLVETLAPGTYAMWRRVGRVQVKQVDLREAAFDVAGQELMTADRVTLRVNATVSYVVTDPARAVSAVEDYKQALYREAQLALRAVVGTRALETLLADKDRVATELLGVVRERGAALGLEVKSLGVRDLILPGEMKELLNQVTAAKTAAEAALITRREEVAAVRSQANTARLLADNPTLMRMRELEVLEKVVEKANLTVVLGEQGLGERVMKLL